MDSFTFEGYDADLRLGHASFRFTLRLPSKTLHFTERIFFPPCHEKIPQRLVGVLLNNINLVLGVSYWKTYCPKRIVLKHIVLSPSQARFWEIVYMRGLGEFFYKNKIDFRDLVTFPYEKKAKTSVVSFPREDRTLLPLGGGKDSIVAAELLRKQRKPFDVLIIGGSSVQTEVTKILGKTPIVIKRVIDRKLFELNRQGAYNGHIPVSAIYAFLSVFAATVYDYRYVVVSNERSANYGNVKYLGLMINHQWSKSMEFEKLFQNYVANFITPDIQYYSLLRTMTELEIAEQFVKYPKYFLAFSSCNRNFTISKGILAGKWCGECPKCAFVFTGLAAYLPKEKVVRIFGKNLLEDKSLVKVFKQLLGVADIKPFECVGTPQEMKQAMHLIKNKGEFDGDMVMKGLDV